MEQSNQILFNEPALHSLKRAQLMALCKRYNIKQSGKNEELVVRLRQYAETLQNKERTADKEKQVSTNDPSNQETSARTSQQWELVEGGPEEENSMIMDKRSRTASLRSMMSIGTVRSHASSKDSNMGSVSSRGTGPSIMSLASSLKRAGSRSSKMSFSTIKTSTTDSIVREPIAHLFPSVPADGMASINNLFSETKNDIAPIDNSLDTTDVEPIQQGTVDGTQVHPDQMTVRLVTSVADRPRVPASSVCDTPSLKPFPSLPLVNGVHKQQGNVSIAGNEQSLPTDTTIPHSSTGSATMGINIPTTPKRIISNDQGNSSMLKAASPTFVFGSPVNAVSNAQFSDAAAAILAEMNKRMGIDATSSAAARVDKDGTINFGEASSSGKPSTITFEKRADDSRFGRVHQKEFEKMPSIADHYSVKRSDPLPKQPLVGTKRKSSVLDEKTTTGRTFSGLMVRVDNTKDKFEDAPASKRQKLGDSAMTKSGSLSRPSASNPVATGALRNRRESRGSKGRRSSGGPTNAMKRPALPPKATGMGRLGLIRDGAAKVVKTLFSSVTNAGHSQASTSKTASNVKATTVRTNNPSRTKDEATTTRSSIAGASLGDSITKSQAPSRPRPPARPSSLAPRNASALNATQQSVSKGGVSSLAPKDLGQARVIRASTASMQRGKLPNFQEGASNVASSISTKLNATSDVSETKTTGNAVAASVSSRTSAVSKVGKREQAQITSEPSAKQELTRQPYRDPDFDPAKENDDGERSRSCSPVPAPPASLSSRPLQLRQPLESTQPKASNGGDAQPNGSLGRKPRISRSKVIAKVHESRQRSTQETTPLKISRPRKSISTARKSIGTGAKAKLMGTDGTRGRASVVAASAVAARRRTTVNDAPGARRRTIQAKV
ncbi:hypothetical protein FRC19_002818 [Serendipita sp. 401]|nr:hypothetical protein FRC19_002818 [Serendipita sp. 401]